MKKKQLKKKLKKAKADVKKYQEELNKLKTQKRFVTKILTGKKYIEAIKYILEENDYEIEDECDFLNEMDETISNGTYSESFFVKKAFFYLLYHSDILEVSSVDGEDLYEHRLAHINDRKFEFTLKRDVDDKELDYAIYNYKLSEFKTKRSH